MKHPEYFPYELLAKSAKLDPSLSRMIPSSEGEVRQILQRHFKERKPIVDPFKALMAVQQVVKHMFHVNHIPNIIVLHVNPNIIVLHINHWVGF